MRPPITAPTRPTNDVSDEAEAAATDNEAGQKAGDEPDGKPGDEMVPRYRGERYDVHVMLLAPCGAAGSP